MYFFTGKALTSRRRYCRELPIYRIAREQRELVDERIDEAAGIIGAILGDVIPDVFEVGFGQRSESILRHRQADFACFSRRSMPRLLILSFRSSSPFSS